MLYVDDHFCTVKKGGGHCFARKQKYYKRKKDSERERERERETKSSRRGAVAARRKPLEHGTRVHNKNL